MVQRTFQVEGMACDGCEQNVIDELSTIEGVSEISPDHSSDKVSVEAEDGVDDTVLVSAIEKAGYEVVG